MLNPNIPQTSYCERKKSINTVAKHKNALSHSATMLRRRFVSLSLVFITFFRSRDESLWDIRVKAYGVFSIVFLLRVRLPANPKTVSR